MFNTMTVTLPSISLVLRLISVSIAGSVMRFQFEWLRCSNRIQTTVMCLFLRIQVFSIVLPSLELLA